MAGAILAPGKRTVTAALRILGREQDTDYPIYHGVLNGAVWSSRSVAAWLLRLLVATFLDEDATVVIGIDDTVERRWGHKISARGIYRDRVRFAKAGGKRLPKLYQVLRDPRTVWQRHTVTRWYGRTDRTVELATGTAVWYRSGLPPVPIRWLLVRDPLGELPPQAFLCTDLDAAPVEILRWFVSRWQLEVTFQDARTHLGVETQRQWSDLAILHTTLALLGLYSLVTLWAHDLAADTPLAPATAAWYRKPHCTFSDAIAAVRRPIWDHQTSCISPSQADVIRIPQQLWGRAANALAYAA